MLLFVGFSLLFIHNPSVIGDICLPKESPWCCFLPAHPALQLRFTAMSSVSQRPYLRNAREVNERTGPWTVIVQVLIKYPTKTAQNNPNTHFKKFLLTDMEGTQISAITFKAIDHFDKLFEPFKRYYVTSASVQVANPKYKVGDYNYTWYLYPRTHVQPIDDPTPHLSPFSFAFTPYSEMFKFADRDGSVAVKGLIVHAIPVPNATRPFVRDYVLIDEEKRPIILRVWSDVFNEAETHISEKLPEPTFIAGVELRVTTHNGLSLTTGFYTHSMVNPPFRENGFLVGWYKDNIEEVAKLVKAEAYKSVDVLLPPPPVSDITPVKQVNASMQQLKTAWVSGRIVMVPTQSKLRHTVCDKCKKTVSLPVGSDLPCMYCKKQMNVEARCHVHVYLNDPSGTLCATLFGSNAEKLIGYTAAEVAEAYEKDAPLTGKIADKIDKATVVFFLKDYDRTSESRFERSFHVVALHVLEQERAETSEQLPLVLPNTQVQGHAITEHRETSPPGRHDTNAARPKLCESQDTGKEKQLFSPNIKGVVNDMAIEVGLNAAVSLPNAAAKRGLLLADSSDDEDKIHAEKIGFSANETNTSAGGSESPVKKPKNAMEHI